MPVARVRVVAPAGVTPSVHVVRRVLRGLAALAVTVAATAAAVPVVPAQAHAAAAWAPTVPLERAQGAPDSPQASRVIVKAVPGRTLAQVPGLRGVTVRERLPLTGAIVVDVPTGRTAVQWAGQLAADPAVAYAAPDVRRAPLALAGTGDPYYDQQWALQNIGQSIPSGGSGGQAGVPGIDVGAPGAWRLATGSPTTVVAVLDSEVDITHPDLAAAIWTNPREIPGNHIDDDRNGYVDDVHGWNFLTGRPDVTGPADTMQHGTHVAGIIGAVTGNAVGVAGLASGVRIMPVPFIGPDGGYDSDAIKAIGYAVANGAEVINASWGASVAQAPGADNPALADAIRSCACVFVAAAGNDGQDMDQTGHRVFPAAFGLRNEVSVAAVDNRGRLAPFSDYGRTTVDLAAPGVGVLSTVPAGYAWGDGTSMAAPYVAATAALMHAANPSSTPAQIAATLRAAARPLPDLAGRVRAGGMVSAAAAVAVAVSNTPTSVAGLPRVPRIQGPDRYATAAAVADLFPAGGPVAYLATGTNFPDALAGAALAARDGAPVLLAQPDVLPDVTAAALARLAPARVVVLGDEAAVAESVRLAAAAYATTGVAERVAGPDRFATGAAVAARFAPGVPVAYLATGASFPDALGAAAVAGASGSPVLITARDTLPPSVAAALRRLAPAQVVVVGGRQAVSEAVAQAAGAAARAPIRRVAGADRYATAASLARSLREPVPVAYVATGTAFPDALAAAALAGARGGPVLVTPPGWLNPAVAGTLAALAPAELAVVGSRSAVSDRVATGLAALTR